MKSKKINAYICDKLHVMVTENKSLGTTPMFMGCDQCHQQATSRMYNVDQTLEPTHEWYKPTDEDWKELEADISSVEAIRGLREHVSNGGVLIRRISDKNYSITLK